MTTYKKLIKHIKNVDKIDKEEVNPVYHFIDNKTHITVSENTYGIDIAYFKLKPNKKVILLN